MTLEDLVNLDVLEAARALVGWTLLADGVGGTIVEVEAYRQDDPASHSFGGPRPRNRTMYGPPGRLYVYRSYGVHWCANVVCRPEGEGAGVLVRALEPLHGLEAMRARRGRNDSRSLCSGPGRLAQALAITGADDGASLAGSRFELLSPPVGVEVTHATRIGITKAAHQPWRFLAAGSPWVSRPPAAGGAT